MQRPGRISGFLAPGLPSAERLAAVPELDLDGVRRTWGEHTDDVTVAYLRTRKAISLANYALAAGLPLNTAHARARRGGIEFAPAPNEPAKKRRHRQIPSAWVAAQLGLSL